VQAYAGGNQWAKAVDAAEIVLRKDPLPSDNPTGMLRLLYAVTSSIPHIPDPSTQQLATGAKAAHLLENFTTAPQGVTATAWASTRADLLAAARAALLYVAIVPAAHAMKANDCAGAEMAAKTVLEEFPESVQAAWFLALSEVCLAKTEPAKASLALYELARAAALDPAKGMVDAKWQQSNVVPYLEKAYTQFHGADPQGLNELRELAVQSPLPPSGFVIKSAAEIARENDEDFERKHPELALWMKIRTALAVGDGEHYFESELKDSAVPVLQGVLIEASPDCRATELRVAIPLPKDSQNARPEVLLKLEKPLTGRPELGGEIRWTGTASAFSRRPFLLTMETQASQFEGLRLSPCQPDPRKKTTPGNK
jgi:hypothetical protein